MYKQFLWIDESGCDKKDNIQKFGYSLRGERPQFITVFYIKAREYQPLILSGRMTNPALSEDQGHP